MLSNEQLRSCWTTHNDGVDSLSVTLTPGNPNPRFDGTDWKSAEKILDALQSVDLSQCKRKSDADAALEKADVLDPQLRAFALMNVIHDRSTDTLRWRIGLDNLVAELQVCAWCTSATKPEYGSRWPIR